MPDTDFLAALRALSSGGVEFIVVGGLAAVLNGAPVNTFDLDIVHRRTDANIERLLTVLTALDAVYRMHRERRLKPISSHLGAPGHHNLITSCGPLDVLGTIGRNLGYEDLLPHTVTMQIDSGIAVRVLDLDTIIEVKEQLGGEKDKAVLPTLRRTREEERRKLNKL